MRKWFFTFSFWTVDACRQPFEILNDFLKLYIRQYIVSQEKKKKKTTKVEVKIKGLMNVQNVAMPPFWSLSFLDQPERTLQKRVILGSWLQFLIFCLLTLDILLLIKCIMQAQMDVGPTYLRTRSPAFLCQIEEMPTQKEIFLDDRFVAIRWLCGS